MNLGKGPRTKTKQQRKLILILCKDRGGGKKAAGKSWKKWPCKRKLWTSFSSQKAEK